MKSEKNWSEMHILSESLERITLNIRINSARLRLELYILKFLWYVFVGG